MMINKKFWEGRYQEGRTGWDIGYPAPGITNYVDQLTRRDLRILLPGAGMGYEAEYLWKCGFHNLTVIDIAGQPLRALRKRIPEIPEKNVIETDFFAFESASFDLILEHTFFCALPPERRSEYVLKMYALLRPGGKLSGLFFDFPLSDSGPPFGGSEEAYRLLFAPYFEIRKLERATKSIPPRAGKELFFIFEKKPALYG